MKQFLCLLLAGLMLLGVTACATTSDGGDETQEALSSDLAESEAETKDPNYVCDLPSDLDYGDKNINILCRNLNGGADEMVPNDAGGVVSDAVYARNVAVEEQLGVVLTMIPSDSIGEDHKMDIEGGLGEYDIIANATCSAVTPAMEGRYLNLTKLENIDTSKHYWTQGYNDMATFTDEGMQFLASGPIAISMFRYMFLTLYNKTLLQDYGIPDLYETVKAGEWTLDYQYTIANGKYLEKDGDNNPTEADLYGFVTGDTVSVDPYMVAADLHLIVKDADTGELQYNSDATAPLSDLCDKVQKLYNDKGTYVYKTATYDDVPCSYIISHFNNGNAMMVTTLFYQMELNFNDLSALSYGIAPMPKFSESQETYNSYVQDQVTSFGISAVVGDMERRDMLAAVMESMAYHSYLLVRPAYYETALSERYMQDPQSEEVLDVIFDTLRFDFSSSCSNIFTSCVLRDNLRPLLSGKTNTIASSTRSWERQIDKALNKLNPKLEKLKDQP